VLLGQAAKHLFSGRGHVQPDLAAVTLVVPAGYETRILRPVDELARAVVTQPEIRSHLTYRRRFGTTPHRE